MTPTDPTWTERLRLFLDGFWPFAGLAAAIGLALLVHAIAMRLLARLHLKPDGFAALALHETRHLSRIALVTLALTIALAGIELPYSVETDLQHLSLILLIVLIGGNGVALIQLAARFALGRFHLEAEDNLRARRSVTQIRILSRTAQTIAVLVTIAAVLLSFDNIKQYGVSLLASAGAAGIVLGFAARPVLANMIAGIQIAISQPIRIDDVVIVEGEWGWIEDIGSTFVTVRLWDWRRMVVPLTWFIENPFQNWTRETAAVIGTVTWHMDYGVPVDRVRAKLEELVDASPRWDRRVVNLQVTEATGHGIELRGLMSARTSPLAWDLRCEIREAMIAWLQAEYPQHLPRWRGEMRGA